MGKLPTIRPVPPQLQPQQGPLPAFFQALPPLTGRVFLRGCFTHQGGWPSADQTFVTAGSIVVVAWSMTGFVTVAGATDGQLFIDGNDVSSSHLFFNVANQHLVYPTKFSQFGNVPGGPTGAAFLSAGTHKMHFAVTGASLGSNADDFAYALVAEFFP